MGDVVSSRGPATERFAGATAMHRARNENGQQQGSEARRSFDTVQIAMEDEIDFGASRPRTTPTVSSVEFSARPTRPSLRERDMQPNCGPVRHVAIRGRVNGGSSHKRPRFIPYRARGVLERVDDAERPIG
ncbi:hypothetical protein [Burkholderia territorii]|uniref:hypothetical protein n=1 Tax=Burkholderia territorii TaxID=1503055 RepID=UPI001E4CCA10|nr:hypothetical protein [Burkholderia territorii]